MNTIVKKRLWAVMVLAAVPVGRYIIDFLAGYFNLDDAGFGLMTALFFVLVAPWIVALIVARLWSDRNGVRNFVGILTLLLTPVLAAGAVPPGATIYSHGFQVALRTRVNLDRLQNWASNAITKYERKELKLDGKAPHWSVEKEIIADSELPAFLKRGLFERNRSHPMVVAVEVLDDHKPVIVVSWYLHGILIGSPDFKTTWNPWYLAEIKPGIYVYHGYK